VAIDCLHATKLDGKTITVNMDIGMSQGRQYGRGLSGYQRKDENNFLQKQEKDSDRELDEALVKDKGYRNKNRSENAD